MKLHYLTKILIAAVILFFSAACSNDTTNPPPPPPPMVLHIYPSNEIYEVDTGANLYLNGQLVNEDGDPIAGYRVDFSLDPDTLGVITPFAVLDPTSSNGFNRQVVFNGRINGEALITGQVWIGESVAARDTLHVLVRPPING